MIKQITRALMMLFVTLGFHCSAWAEEQSSKAQNTQTTMSVEDKAYTQQLMQLSTQIAQKIQELAAKQRQIDAEVYPAYVAPLQAEKAAIQQQLDALQMQKTQLESQKTSNDMAAKLKAAEGKSQ